MEFLNNYTIIASAGVSSVDTRRVYQAGEHYEIAVAKVMSEAIFDCTGELLKYFCNLKRELGCILACVDEIGEETCHAELVSASDQRRMDKFSVSRHCEHSEAIPRKW